ncbi:hypothetical protein [Lacticaseibacillus parakribbianus]|uniref:hypothetical protein n=1 Tax=Lacticaseibacillus parakribbianus TaxID=2970927 RepID=UPI0021CB8A3D|nr:hypothetical protein [Lacticaseibacillus parakribbianus]
MPYSVIGASYQNQSLAVFYAGLDQEPLLTFEAATQKALSLLASELSASTLPDLHDLTDRLFAFLQQRPLDLAGLTAAVGERLSVSWFADDHFVIAVMDESETYQLHVEVVPVQTA